MTSSSPSPRPAARAAARPAARGLEATSAVGGADHLIADGISRSFGARRVLTDVSFTVSSAERAALIGENGSGKSTLLRILAGLDDDHTGRVHAPGEVGLYHQQPPFDPDQTLEQVLKVATARQHGIARAITEHAEALAADPHDTSAATAYDAALTEAERIGAWDVETRTDRLLEGLGLAHLDRARPTRELSGGQVSRLSLAWLLLRRPDTLLLDEPTNHLDATAAALVTELLRAWSGLMLFASHDRAFLDEVATTLLDLDPAPRPHATVVAARGQPGESPDSGVGLTRFGGSYTDYLLHRIDERERWERRYRDEQEELRRLRRLVAESRTVGHPGRAPRTEARSARKFYADRNAKVVSRRVNDAATALARREEEQVRKPPAVLRFAGLAAAVEARRSGPEPGSGSTTPGGRPTSSGPVLVATEIAVTGRLRPVSVALGTRDRLLVTGPNGVGKSTLLQVLAGVLEPDDGAVTTPPRTTVGLLGQETGTVHLGRDSGRSGAVISSPDATVAEAYRRAVGEERASVVPLGTFGLVAGRDENRRFRELSVGQQRRLELAVLLADPPEVLLLDEPTNHFSLLLATQVEASIPDYPGAVVVASHDRWLQAGWRGRRMELEPIGAGPGSPAAYDVSRRDRA